MEDKGQMRFFSMIVSGVEMTQEKFRIWGAKKRPYNAGAKGKQDFKKAYRSTRWQRTGEDRE